MIEILPAPDHVAAFRVSGTVQASDYDTAIPEIEEKLRAHEEIGVMVDASGFSDMTAEALRRDIGYGLEKLGELHRFRRVALMTDKQWMKAVLEMTDKLFPGMEARVFSDGEDAAAMDWAAETPGPS